MSFVISLTQMLVFLSFYVMLGILLSISVCAATSLFCACLVSVQVSLQADGMVAFEDIPVFGVCRPAWHDSSLYLFVLVLFLEAVVLSQVHVALDIFYQHIVHVYRGVVYNHHLWLCDVHMFICSYRLSMTKRKLKWVLSRLHVRVAPHTIILF